MHDIKLLIRNQTFNSIWEYNLFCQLGSKRILSVTRAKIKFHDNSENNTNMFPVTQKNYPNIPLGKPLHVMITCTKQILNQYEVCGRVRCKSIPIVMVFTSYFTMVLA